MKIANFFPPAHLFKFPLPQIQGNSYPLHCMPYLLYETKQNKIQYHSFFLLLQPPSTPKILVIESITIFSPEIERNWQLLHKIWNNLMSDFQAKTIIFRVYHAYIDNPYYPTTGFWTSAFNSVEISQLIKKMNTQLHTQSEVWRIQTNHIECPQDIINVHHSYQSQCSPVHWSELFIHLSIGDHWGEANIIPNIFDQIEAYGKLPQLISINNFVQARVQLNCYRLPFIEQSLDVLINYLWNLGFNSIDLNSTNEYHYQLSNSLVLRGGLKVADMQEYIYKS